MLFDASQSRPSSRLVEELAAPLELLDVSPRPPSRPRPAVSRPSLRVKRRTEAQKEELELINEG